MPAPTPSLPDGLYFHRAPRSTQWRPIEVIDAIPYARHEGADPYAPIVQLGDVHGPLVRPGAPK